MAKQQKKRNKKYNPNKVMGIHDRTFDTITRTSVQFVREDKMLEIFDEYRDAINAMRGNKMTYDEYYSFFRYSHLFASFAYLLKKEVVIRDESGQPNHDMMFMFKLEMDILQEIFERKLCTRIADMLLGYQKHKQWVIDYPLLAEAEEALGRIQGSAATVMTVGVLTRAGLRTEQFFNAYADKLEEAYPDLYEDWLMNCSQFYKVRDPISRFGEQVTEFYTPIGKGTVSVRVFDKPKPSMYVRAKLGKYVVDITNFFSDEPKGYRIAFLNAIAALIAMQDKEPSIRFFTVNYDNPDPINSFFDSIGVTRDEYVEYLDKAEYYYYNKQAEAA